MAREKMAGLAWVERTLGGKIVAERTQERWRPQYFLDVETAGGDRKSVIMRGFRSPGYASPDEASSRAMLQLDGEMLEALQDLPVKAPRYYGHNAKLGWVLMECVPGDAEITELTDEPLKRSIFQEYLEDIARLHSQPLERVKVPSMLTIPRNIQDHVKGMVNATNVCFEQNARPDPEPLYRLALAWALDNPLHDRPIRLGLGDVGPNQFIFKDGHYQALFDCEYATVGDPLMEIGLMRSRMATYPIANGADHILHYGKAYEGLTGESLDIKALEFWSVFAQVAYMMHFNPAIQVPSPTLPDAVFAFAFEAQSRRSIPECLADMYRRWSGLRCPAC